MKILHPNSPFPNIYARGKKGKTLTAEKSKEQVLPEVPVANIQPMVQKDYQPTKSYEEILKDA